MKYKHIICAAVIISFLSLIGCRSGNKHQVENSTQSNNNAEEISDSTSNPTIVNHGNRLILSMPDCTNKKADETIEITLQGEFIDPFYQISGRLKFDANNIRPVNGNKGNWFSDTDIAYFNLNQKDCLPFALTPKYGTTKSRVGNGTLARFRFRIIDPSKDCRIQLDNDLNLLNIRNDQQGRLAVSLEREVTK